MRYIILTAVVLNVATTFASFAAESKKDITAKQIIGTWKNIRYIQKNRFEGTKIYSASGKYYLMTEFMKEDGSVSSSTETGTYSVDDNGDLVELAEPNKSEGKAVVDWIDQNTVMLRYFDRTPLQWIRSK